MAQQNDTGVPAAVLRLGALPLDGSPDRAPDDLAIFTVPGVEAVFQWWLESNRRWTTRDAANPPPIARPGTPGSCPQQR